MNKRANAQKNSMWKQSGTMYYTLYVYNTGNTVSVERECIQE